MLESREYLDAMQRVRELRDSGRYMEDVWGVLLNREVALPQVVRERYDRGTGWVSRLTRKLGANRGTTSAIHRY